jgi:two-component system, OmpR family, phosphate regulon sensor histidine kinase PhoR
MKSNISKIDKKIKLFNLYIQQRGFYLGNKVLFLKYARFIFHTIFPFITTALLVSAKIMTDQSYYPSPFLLLLIIVLFHAFIGGTYSGILASIITSVAGNYYLMDPFYILKLDSWYYLIPTIAHLIQSLIVTTITTRYFQSNINLRKTTQILSRARDQFEDISEKIFTLSAITDEQGLILEANKTYYDLSKGIDRTIRGNYIYNTFPWVIDKHNQEKLKNYIEKIKPGESLKFEDLLPITIDKMISIEVSINSISRKNETPFLIISAIDISDRKRAERSAIREQIMYSNLINANIIGIIFTNSERKLSNANKAFLRLSGYKLSEIKRKKIPLQSLMPEIYHKTKSSTISQILKKGYGGPIEIEIISKHGKLIPVLLSGVLINPEINQFIFLIVDLTEQKRLERKKDEFISIAGHELKTPLTIIKGYVQMMNLNLQQSNTSNFPKYLKVLNAEVNKLTSLLNELLDISKIESNKLILERSDFNIVELLRKLIVSVEPLKGTKTIELQTEEKKIIVNADKNRINQVVLNFITNALKHSPKNGQIIVRSIKNSTHVRIEVQDFGKGIHKDKMEKIFKKFFQINRGSGNLQGLGLGLYISKEIISIHEGDIGVESEYGQGATFYFTLPIN